MKEKLICPKCRSSLFRFVFYTDEACVVQCVICGKSFIVKPENIN